MGPVSDFVKAGKHSRMVYPLLLGVWCILLFLPVINFEFVSFDDPGKLTARPVFVQLTWSGIASMWNPKLLALGHVEDFSPIRDMSYLFDLCIWGWSSSGFHMTQALLHLLNALLAYVYFRMHVSSKAAFVGALAWAVHPLVVEPVSWVTARKDIWVGTATLIVLLSVTRPLATCGGVILGLLSKTNAVVLAPLSGVVSWLRQKSIRWVTVVSLTLFSVAFGAYVTLASWQPGGLVSEVSFREAYSAWPMALRVYTHDIQKILWPTELSPRYFDSAGVSAFHQFAGLILMFLTGLGIYFFRRSPRLLEGIILFIFGILPNFLQLAVGYPIARADRYLYVPLLGAALCFGILVDYLNERIPRFGISFLVIPLFLSFLTFRQLPVWQDSFSLWTRVVHTSPKIYYAWDELGLAQMERNDLGTAQESFAKALKLDPKWWPAYVHLAAAQIRAGLKKESRETLVFVESTASAKELAGLASSRGNVWARLGDPGRAAALYREWLESWPTDFSAWNNLGAAYLQLNQWDKALDAFEHAIALRPDFALARLNRARVWKITGRCANSEQPECLY